MDVRTPTTFAELINLFLGMINIAIPMMLMIVVAILSWKIFDAWIIHADDESKRAEGKSLALTAALVTTILIIIWGIVALMQQSIFG